MAQNDVWLLLLVVIAAVAVIGLILALQTGGGRRRLADAGLRLAEALIALAVRWLEQNLPPGSVAQAAVSSTPPAETQTLLCAQAALGSLAERRNS